MQRGGDWDSYSPKAAREVSTRNLNMSAAPETFLAGELVPTLLLYLGGPSVTVCPPASVSQLSGWWMNSYAEQLSQ